MSQLDLFEANSEWRIGNSSGPEALFATRYSLLADRLYAAGLSRPTRIEVHTNRRVLVSLTSRGALRVHRGYDAAPDEVIAAIARWARPRIRRTERLEAQRILSGFPVHIFAPPTVLPSGRPTVQPGDERIFARLHQLHDRFNQAHFGNALGKIRVALSGRMRRRLGEFRLSATGMHEIVIGRRHLRRDGWRGVEETLLHEMVHQWQAETGRKLGHGAEFRKMLHRVSGVGCRESGNRDAGMALEGDAGQRQPDWRVAIGDSRSRPPTPDTRLFLTRLSLEF